MPDILKYDVVVVGGGAAGVSAATAAARYGARVALLENHSFLGGKATAAFVGTICGLYLRNEEHKLIFASSGFPREFAEKIMSASNTIPNCNKQGLWYLPYHPFSFMQLCDNFISAGKIDLFLHTVICNVNSKEDRISKLHAISYDREIIFEPIAVIDCTGEAMVSKLAALEVEECDEYQASAQVFYMENVLPTDPGLMSLLLIREIKKAIEAGKLGSEFENISIIPGSQYQKRIGIKIGIPEKITNQLNKITPIEILARKMVNTVSVFLQKSLGPFKSAYISGVAPEVGIRTGRRPAGKQILTKEIVINCSKFDDGIANGSWPIEQWGLGKRVNMQYFATDNYYQIPAGCLIAKKCLNLFFAGRHISADNEAIASARVIGTCLATGFASGLLASSFADNKSMNQAVENIRREQVI